MKEAYDIAQKIKWQMSDLIGECPRQLNQLHGFINENKTDDVITLSFTEEVKDGRNSKFLIPLPLLIKNKTFGDDEFKIKIIDIVYRSQEDQESDYNRYINYYYTLTIKKI